MAANGAASADSGIDTAVDEASAVDASAAHASATDASVADASVADASAVDASDVDASVVDNDSFLVDRYVLRILQASEAKYELI